MDDKILELLEESKKINGEVIALTRLLILALLSYFADGIQYRELKTALNISDGKLISNLRKLEKFGYVKKEEIKINRKRLDVYSITESGLRDYKRVLNWLTYLIDMVNLNVQESR